MTSAQTTHPSDSEPATLVGIDVGGTFTDFVVLHAGELRVHKVPTTPDDQSQAIAIGLDELGIAQASVAPSADIPGNLPDRHGSLLLRPNSLSIVHGMTVATNALLERKGAKTALLTSAGFADVLIIGRQNRPHIYRLSQARPEPLVAGGLRLDVPERIDAQGQVLAPLDEAAVERLLDHLAEAGVESVAVVLLFSFRNDRHERRIAELIRRRLPDLPISLSSAILPEYREYERTATTVINAYVQPLVARYLARLADRLAVQLTGCDIRIMQSNGGAIGITQAAEQAARVVLSGPAGGVVGAFAVTQQALNGDAPYIITFDMGGTSTDVALCSGRIPTTAEGIITDLPLRLPTIDIHTVGAGGGSIAYVDAGGALRVGPQSAGAIPGPACYDRGGELPTVTDANLVLGRLDAQGFLGGRGQVRLNAEAAQRVLAGLGAQLNLSAQEAALGVIRVANATMERALRQVSVERGHDPRRFTLLPFGGAGPLHACELAEALRIERIFIPPMPGVLSAYGMLVADVVHDLSQTVLAPAAALIATPAPLQQAYAQLAAQVRAVLQAEQVQSPRLEAALDMRYRGQSYELTVPYLHNTLPEAGSFGKALPQALDAFHAAHEQRYGYAMPNEPVEVVNLRVRGVGAGADVRLPRAEPGEAQAHAARLGEKPVWFTPARPTPTALYDRARLQPNNRFTGPALVYQYDATLLLPPGWTGRVDDMLNLWMERTP